jgi:hypothetical protein
MTRRNPNLIPDLRQLVVHLEDDGGSDSVLAADLLALAIPIIEVALSPGPGGEADQWWPLVRQTFDGVQATAARLEEYLLAEQIDDIDLGDEGLS